MLDGNKIRLKVLEKEDLPTLATWNNEPDFSGEYEPFEPSSYAEFERWFAGLRSEEQWFIIENKDGSKIGQLICSPKGPHYSIGYRVIPKERNKGFATEAVKIAVDYLFLSKNMVRIESETNPHNAASSRVLEKAGFRKEGLIRKSVFIRGEWKDGMMYSILRDEWKTPRILRGINSKKR